jgi:predicted dehydrogenase
LSFAEGHVVAAIGSRSLDSAQRFSDQFGGLPFGSYQSLVEQDLDGVYVATPHPFHRPNTLLALENGKPVLCEKPFSVNAKESAEMIAKAKEKNLLLVEAMWSRFLPHYRLVRDLIQQGVLGEIRFLYADHGQNLPAERHARLHLPELAGGALLDLGIYPISLSYLIFGKPAQITARASFTESGVDESTSIIFEYDNNHQANLHTTLSIKTPCTATVIGTKATLEIHGSFYTPTSMSLKHSNGEVINYPKEYLGHGLREQAIEFAKLVSEGKKESELMTLSDSQSIMETMDEIRKQIGLAYRFEN